ncbi:hypothetical protein CTI12_AA513280 [Artemisia annua]|uniref:Uncharacterized protein n=1 Tax=Artemisia annua TaxID=35608 RepID=A0A2U1LAK1_ARTAN|nr:hypothetical protein CTI12_AA513280 [Artemisia annua]
MDFVFVGSGEPSHVSSSMLILIFLRNKGSSYKGQDLLNLMIKQLRGPGPRRKHCKDFNRPAQIITSGASSVWFQGKWCDQNGEALLEVVQKECKDHVNEIKSMSIAVNKEPKKIVEESWATYDDASISNSIKEEKKTVKLRWTTFDDNDESCHPNSFAERAPVSSGFELQIDNISKRNNEYF